MRLFESGATRDTDENKFDYIGFLSPQVLEQYASYMHKHRVQSDGTLRAANNWKKGIPLSAYLSSGSRHFMEWWILTDRGRDDERADRIEALCALMFNVMGAIHVELEAASD